jgi:hypothetical protein
MSRDARSIPSPSDFQFPSRHARPGRQATRATEVHGFPANADAAVDGWLDALSALPVEQWMAAGQVCRSDAYRRDAVVARARAHVEALIAGERLDVAAWRARDAVETLAHTAAVHTSHRGSSARRTAALARDAAGWLALAALVRACLTRPEYDALRAPFAAFRGGAPRAPSELD